MKNILISIITIVYNREKGIEKTIKSVLGQDYKNIEYIIMIRGIDIIFKSGIDLCINILSYMLELQHFYFYNIKMLH